MQVNRTTMILAAAMVLLVGIGSFMLGQRSSSEAAPATPVSDVPTLVSGDAPHDEEERKEPAEDAQSKALAIRIGRDGPRASACERIGRGANLPHEEDDFLSVREAPSIEATRIDELADDAPVFVCDRQGQWYGIVYLSDGTLGEPDECELADAVPSPRAYAGPCLTGWVHASYVDASGAQDSDEAYVEDEAEADRTRTVQVSATGPSQAIAVTRMAAKAESEQNKPTGQRPDGNRVNCRETGSGDAMWTCTASYTLTKQAAAPGRQPR